MFTVSSQGKIQCSSKTRVASECQDTGSEISPPFVGFFPAGGLFTVPVQRSLPGIEGSLLCVGTKEGGNRTLQVFILKVYHAFGCLLVPKLIMLVEEVQKQNKQSMENK